LAVASYIAFLTTHIKSAVSDRSGLATPSSRVTPRAPLLSHQAYDVTTVTSWVWLVS